MKLSFILLLVLIPQLSLAEWALVNHVSSVNYISSTKNVIGGVGSFSNMDGTISDEGELSLRVDLSSIETHSPKRNDQIQDLLLETKRFQEALFSISLNKDFVKGLTFSKATHVPVTLTFMFHGVVQKLDIVLLIIHFDNGYLHIKTYNPIILVMSDYNLDSGLKNLGEIETFKGITNQLPVSLNLFFRPAPTP